MDNTQLLDFVKKQDPGIAKILGGIITGEIVSNVRCMSSKCKGRLIGQIYKDGTIREVADKEGKVYLRASRKRLDGFYGFECWCGANSKIAKQEEGILFHTGNTPSKTDVERIYEGIQKHPSKYANVNGSINVDGFLMEGVK